MTEGAHPPRSGAVVEAASNEALKASPASDAPSPLLRSLSYYRRRHLTVAAGAAIASAVLAGALMVGDSVRDSLQALTLDRLGSVDRVLAAEGFLEEDLAERLLAEEAVSSAFAGSAAALVLPASATAASSGALASNVTLLGVDDAFLELYPEQRRPAELSFDDLPRQLPEADGGQRLLFPPVVLNSTLAGELGVGPGDEVLLAFTRFSDVPRASIMGRKGAADVVQKLRLSVVRVIEDRGPGAFSLSPHQGLPRLAYVSRSRLQRTVDQPGKVNLLLLAGSGYDAEPVELAEGLLEGALRRQLDLEDLSLRLEIRRPPDAPSAYVALESDRFLLPDSVRDTAETLATERGAVVWPSLSYLANRITGIEGASSGRSVPYSSVSALDLPPGNNGNADGGEGEAPFGTLRSTEGPVRALAADEVLINRWTADQLGAQPGDLLELTYFAVGEDENLVEDQVRLRLADVVEMEGLGADPELTPEFPGISGTDDIADWDPPFPLDLGAIRPQDEDYWDAYQGTPKAFVALETGQDLWRSRFGALTSLRLAPRPDRGNTGGDNEGAQQALEDLESFLRAEVPQTVDLAPFGLRFEPVRQQGLTASRGATDFGQLFVAFSWFLIVAASLLVGLLFRLGVEERVREVGLLRALGFPARRVRRLFLLEGLAVAAAGALVGLLGAVAYGAAMVAALSTWWRPAVGSSRLELSVTPTALGVGFITALAVVALTLWLSVRRLREVETPQLLAGAVEPSGTGVSSGRWSRWLALAATLIAVGLTVALLLRPEGASPALYFGLGAMVLVAGLGAFSAWARGRQGKALALRPGNSSLLPLALGNAARNPGRSALAVTLVACASFVLVLVAANRRVPGNEMLQRASGAGGFALFATTEAPVFQNLSRADDRFDLGLRSEAEAGLEGTEVFALRRRPGDDASCLNLYQPEDPTLLGVSRSLRQRGGFTFQAVQASDDGEVVANPWTLLETDLAPGSDGHPVLPAIADYETAMWILKVGLGNELTVEDARGEPVHLRFVALLASSIFQSEVLIAEEALLDHFPGIEGFTTFLVGAPGGALPTEADASTRAQALASSQQLAAALESDLADFGFDAVTTAQRLAAYKAVQNTYLSTFQTLGGLGLLLGTLGLAVVLLRNVNERRGELAVLRAFGFRTRRLKRMILLENTLLLLLGLALGTVGALLAAAPYLLASTHRFPWASVSLTLGAVAITGILACAIATSRALGDDLIPALRSL